MPSALLLRALRGGGQAPGHRGRRPLPGDLRLARRLRGQPRRLPRALPARRRRPAPPVHAQRRTTAAAAACSSLANALSPTAAGRATPGCPSCCRAPASEQDGTVRVRAVDDARRGGGLARRLGPRPRRPRDARRRGTSRSSSGCAQRLRAAPRALGAPRPPGRGRRPWRPAVPARGRRPGGGAARSSTSPTANASLVRLLTGPRWRIGPRDLALLGRRAADLVRARPAGAGRRCTVDPAVVAERALGGRRRGRRPGRGRVAVRGDRAAGRQPPTRRRPGPGSPGSRRSCASLRRHLGEPLLDLLRRVLATTGLDVESRGSDGLVAFLDHAAVVRRPRRRPEPARVPRLPGGRGGVRARPGHLRTDAGGQREADDRPQGQGTGVAGRRPARRDARASFPSATGRPRWTQSAKTLAVRRCEATPRTSRVVTEWTNKGLEAFQAATKELDQLEERRLGYVAVTRAKQRLIASAHWWGPTQSKPRGPSVVPRRDPRRTAWPAHGEVVHWEPQPEEERNPAPRPRDDLRLAAGGRSRRCSRRGATAPTWYGPRWRAATAAPTSSSISCRAPATTSSSPSSSPTGTATWPPCWPRPRRAPARPARCRCPPRCRRRRCSGWRRDPEGLARDLARPMPRAPKRRRPPAAPASTPGSRRSSACSRCSTAPTSRAPPTTTSRRLDDDLAALQDGVPRRALRRPAAPPGRGAVPAGARRAGGPRPDRRRLPARGRQLRGRRLEDRAQPEQTRCSSRSTAPRGPRSPVCPRSPSVRRSTTSPSGARRAPRRPAGRR